MDTHLNVNFKNSLIYVCSDTRLCPTLSRQIPKAFAPFNAQQDLTHSWGDDITVSIFDSEDDCTPLSITNMGELISVTGHCYVTYDLASMYCPELADLRVAYDGTSFLLFIGNIRTLFTEFYKLLRHGLSRSVVYRTVISNPKIS